jgi:hypothetical protein
VSRTVRGRCRSQRENEKAPLKAPLKGIYLVAPNGQLNGRSRQQMLQRILGGLTVALMAASFSVVADARARNKTK